MSSQLRVTPAAAATLRLNGHGHRARSPHDANDFSDTMTDALRKKNTLNNETKQKQLPTPSSKTEDMDSYDSLAQTLHSQEPLAKTVRQL